MRKFMKSFLPAVLILSLLLVGCGSNDNSTDADGEGNGEANEQLKIGMVTDLGSVNDKSFNQSAWEGLQKLQEDKGYEVQYLEPKSDGEVVPNLLEFVNAGYDLTWGTAATLQDAITEIAESNPDAKLGIVDAVVDMPNVASVTFKEEEGSFLVGVIAGLTTETDKVGFVGGMEIPVIKRFESGFKAGVEAVNPDAEIIINYTGDFSRVDMGKSAASTIYDDGADIIFHASGLTGNGIFTEAQERFDNGERVWVIGVDMDQSLTFGDDITLTSMIKKVDEAVYQVSEQLEQGEFPGGEETSLGLKEDGVDIAPTSDKNVDPEVLEVVEEYRQKIIDGEIEIPVN